jgi:hypothetical protein
VREAAASGIGQLVEVTSPKFLQPFLIKITGPLIRIVGDRFPSAVKAAILHTLGASCCISSDKKHVCTYPAMVRSAPARHVPSHPMLHVLVPLHACAGLLLDKGGASLKPFVPQLQTTFVKAIGDPGATVRQRGLTALGQLVVLTTRVDPLIAELSQGAASAETAPPVREDMLKVPDSQIVCNGQVQVASSVIVHLATTCQYMLHPF